LEIRYHFVWVPWSNSYVDHYSGNVTFHKIEYDYIIKDLYSWILLILFIILLVFFNSNYYGHPDNYIPGDFMVTPTQIVPEWYFLSLYAILRSVPSKLGGLLVLVVVFIFLIFLPYLIGIFQVVRNTNFKPFNKYIMPIFF